MSLKLNAQVPIVQYPIDNVMFKSYILQISDDYTSEDNGI